MKISNGTPNYINQTYTNPANVAASQNQKSEKTAEEAANGTKRVCFHGGCYFLKKPPMGQKQTALICPA